MRILIGFLLALSAFSTTSAFAEFRGTLLSYDQLMVLTPEKRINYLADYRKLLIMMEKQQVKYDLASLDNPEDQFSEKIANVMQIFALIPQSDAADAGGGVKKNIVPKTAVKDPAVKDPGPKTEAEQKPASVKIDDSKPAADPLCDNEPAINCSEMTADKKTAIEEFRKNKSGDSNACIVGGFISKYSVATPRKREGKCELVKQFPPLPSKAAQSCKGEKETMCNPFLFCVDGKNADLAGKIEPHYHCESVVDKTSGSDVTQRCDKWQQSTEKDPRFKACDPKQTIAYGKVWIPTKSEMAKANGKPVEAGNEPNRPPDIDFEKVWNDQKETLQKEFKRRCLDKDFDGKAHAGFEGGFQALFCNECKIMAAHLQKMNKDAIGYGCTAKADLAPAAPATPAEAAH